jgi:CRP-like cAMP-binding protein
VAPLADDIGRAAAGLAAAPGDLTTWLELATLLAAAHRPEADDAFAGLGRAASSGGHVALAVACARWLAPRKPDVAGALVDEIVQAHAAGSSKVDASVRPPLPQPRAAAAAPAPSTTSEDAAFAAAVAAIDAARAHAEAHAPAKLAPTPLVSALPPAELAALVEVMTPRAVPAGAEILALGAPADALFWIARGAVRASRGAHVLGELGSGAFFGEIALVGGTTRTATVTALEDSWLIEIPAAELEAVAARQPRLARVLANHARARLLANVVRTSELFARMSEEDRADLLGRFSTALVPAGQTIIQAGADNEHLWVVVSGKVEVRGDGGAVLATIGPGESVGEMSLLARKPATADVVTAAPTAMLRLAREEFEAIAVKYPELLAEVYKLVVARDQENRKPVVDASDLVV